jgi:hypothetical protein
LLGALASVSISHFGEPRRVTPQRQPEGAAPGASWSKDICAGESVFIFPPSRACVLASNNLVEHCAQRDGGKNA